MQSWKKVPRHAIEPPAWLRRLRCLSRAPTALVPSPYTLHLLEAYGGGHTSQVLAPALPRVAVGRLGTAPALLTAKTLAAAGHVPAPGKGRLRVDGMGVCRVEGRSAKYVLVWDVISLSGAFPTL